MSGAKTEGLVAECSEFGSSNLPAPNNETETSCLNNENQNSFIPMLEECERFIKFMNTRFNLELPNDWVVTINKAGKKTIGHFASKEVEEHFINTTQNLNNINLNTYFLKEHSPYECLAHELAHFVNYTKKIKDCSSNQYHNKEFKKQAELLLLSVERGKKGYNITKESEEFNLMLEEEFKPNGEVFNICQKMGEKSKVGSRLKLYMCDCGVKIRCAVDLNAVCQDCNSEFKKQGGEDED